MDASGNIQESVALNSVSESDRAKITSINNKCKSEKGATVCETAHKVYKCYKSIKL